MNPVDRVFYQCFMDCGLVQLVSEPTFVPSGNILDLCLVSCAEEVGEVGILPPLPRCHHSPVLLELLIANMTKGVPKSNIIRMYNKANFSAISEELASVDWVGLFGDNGPSEC